MQNGTQRKFVVAGICLVVIAGCGYLSNMLTVRTCEQRVATWLSKDVMRGQRFNVLENDATPSTLAILDQVGAQYDIYDHTDGEFDGFPWCYVRRAKSGVPFIVYVEWGWQLEGTNGSGHTRRFLSLFGFSIELGDTASGWAS